MPCCMQGVQTNIPPMTLSHNPLEPHMHPHMGAGLLRGPAMDMPDLVWIALIRCT